VAVFRQSSVVVDESSSVCIVDFAVASDFYPRDVVSGVRPVTRISSVGGPNYQACDWGGGIINNEKHASASKM